MTREELKEIILSYKQKHTILQLPTGYGKSRIALEILNSRYPEGGPVLIVVPKLVLIDTWKAEINKWYPKNKWDITFTTYVSFHKHSIKSWDMVIFDECHHITDRIKESFYQYRYRNTLYLSATVKRELISWLKYKYRNNIDIVKLSLKDAIDDNVLPEPKVFLIPLGLNNTYASEVYIKNKKAKKVIETTYANRKKYWSAKNVQLRIKCTPYEYLKIMDDQISFYKTLYMNSQAPYQKNLWLHLAGERLKYLSIKKEEMIKKILKKLSKKRVITFCSDIAQTERLGKNIINSKSKKSSETLDKFNEGIINHITCCNMLNEGVNLSECQYGIWAVYNSSSIMIIQKIGRLLRHENPVIILPFFLHTREEEIVNKMIENVNENNIVVTSDLNEIRI